MVFSARRRSIKLIGTNHFLSENLAGCVPVVSRYKPFYNWLLWHWTREVFGRLDAVVDPSRTAVKMLKVVRLKPHVSSISCGVNASISTPFQSWIDWLGGPVMGTIQLASCSFSSGGLTVKNVWM
jgi:hypothetical protein